MDTPKYPEGLKAFEIFRKSLLLLVLAICVFSAFANGDPVTWYSAVNRVANPDPMPIPDINIQHEQIDIVYQDGYLCFDITYIYKNTSKDVDYPEIHYGFPVDYYVGDENEERMMLETFIENQGIEVGWSDAMVKDIAFCFNGKELPYTMAKETVREAVYDFEGYAERSDTIKEYILYEPGINRRWYYTKFGINAQATDTLNVKYRVYAVSAVSTVLSTVEMAYSRQNPEVECFDSRPSFLLRHFTSSFHILYDFSPAKYFGNGAGYFTDLNIDLSNLKNPRTEIGEYLCQVNQMSRWFLLEPGETDPMQLDVYYDPDLSETYVSAILENFAVNPQKYKINKKDNKVTIDFNEPTFVTDLACDIDSAAVKTINATLTYADGHMKEYVYVKDNPYKKWYELKENFPTTILKVTDVYYNQEYFTKKTKPLRKKNPAGTWEEWPEFMITKIELKIEPEEGKKAGASALGGIRVIDARQENVR